MKSPKLRRDHCEVDCADLSKNRKDQIAGRRNSRRSPAKQWSKLKQTKSLRRSLPALAGGPRSSPQEPSTNPPVFRMRKRSAQYIHTLNHGQRRSAKMSRGLNTVKKNYSQVKFFNLSEFEVGSSIVLINKTFRIRLYFCNYTATQHRRTLFLLRFLMI